MDFNTVKELRSHTLREACYVGDLGLVKFLIKTDVEHDSSLWGDSKRTNLMYAAMQGNYDVVNFLIKKGVDINYQDSSGNTALHYAASGVSILTVRYLIDAGALLNISNKNGQNPLMYSLNSGTGWFYDPNQIKKKHVRLVSLLLQHGSEPNPNQIDEISGGQSSQQYIKEIKDILFERLGKKTVAN